MMTKKIKQNLKEVEKFFSQISLEPCEKEQAVQAIALLKELLRSVPEEVSPPSFAEHYPLPAEVQEKHYALFADGACRGNPGPGSWGAMGQNDKGELLFESSGVDMLTTNNKMELQATISAYEELFMHLEKSPMEWQSITVHLYSDSKYVIEGLKEWMDGWKKRGWKKSDNKTPENLELWQRLDEIIQKISHKKFHWVKGHSGHPQNERCDELANLALDSAGL
ncbi:MAG: ribonuclease HI [Bacteriovoracaceae bacterium]|nr:ribonuclease HI [Bacteriovoracaceae bacterium]